LGSKKSCTAYQIAEILELKLSAKEGLKQTFLKNKEIFKIQESLVPYIYNIWNLKEAGI